jgi:hypothetical protein
MFNLRASLEGRGTYTYTLLQIIAMIDLFLLFLFSLGTEQIGLHGTVRSIVRVLSKSNRV